MKFRYIKLIGAAMLTVAMASCQDEKMADITATMPNSLRATMSGWGVKSRAQVELGNQQEAQEIFQWNAGDGFSLIDLDSEAKTAVRYEIAGYNADEPSATAEFVGKGELPQSHKLLAIYPQGELADGKVALSVEQNSSYTYFTQEEIVDYMTKNMVMIATGLVGETQTDLKFSQATAMVRVSLTNAKGEAMKVSSVSITSPAAFGLAGEYNTADGKVSLTGTAADVMTQKVQSFNILSGETVDFYFLALPGSGIGDFEIAVNDEKVTVPASEFADKGIEKLEAGNRYWFQLVEGNNGLLRKATVGEGIITNLSLIRAIEVSQGIEFYRNEDGFVEVLSNKELIEKINTLTIDGADSTLTELTGIEYFTNLEYFSISNSTVRYANFSLNAKLKGISIRDCFDFEDINVGGLENLRTLTVQKAKISTINLTTATNIENLSIYDTNITTLDLTPLLHLQSAFLDLNKLTTIDVSKNEELDYLSVVGPEMAITELNVENNKALTTLRFGSNFSNVPCPIKEINLENNLKLESLDISSCRELMPIDLTRFENLRTLTIFFCDSYNEIDVSRNPELESLSIFGCKNITSLNVRENPLLTSLHCGKTGIEELDLSNNKLLQKLQCQETGISELDLSLFEDLRNLNCGYCHIKELNITKNPWLNNIRCGNQINPETHEYLDMVLYMLPEQKEMWLEQEAYSNHVRVEMVTE